MGEKGSVSIIVPLVNWDGQAAKCINSLRGLEYYPYDILLVDDGLAKQDRLELERRAPGIKVLSSHRRGPSYARNLAARNTDAEFLAFTDSDCIVPKDWLKQLLKGFDRFPDAVACGGAQRLPEDATVFEEKVFKVMKKTGSITDYMRKVKKDDIVEVGHNPSCNVIYKRDIFLKEGGFLEGLWPGEDVELDYRLSKKGYNLVFNPQAVVYHYRPKDLKSFLKMMYRYGQAQGFLVRKHGIFRIIQILPIIFSFGILLLIYRAFFGHLNIGIFVIGGGLLTIFLYLELNIFTFFLIVSGFLSWGAGYFRKLMTG